MTIKDFIGRQVKWTKLEGEYNPWVGENGFGVLISVDVGRDMRIMGDYGVFTSNVKSIEVTNEGMKITTQNSVYLVK